MVRMPRVWALLAALCLAAPLAPTHVLAQTTPLSTAAATQQGSPLEQAQKLYDQSQFIQAADLLEQAMEQGRVTGDDRNAARELRARCLVKGGRRLEGKEAFKSLLRSDPAYRADPVQVPPDEMEVFNAALKEFQQEQLEAGRRVPASIGFFYGMGQAINQDIVDLASSAGVGDADDFNADGEFGYS